ncbi:MAG: SH3 domain-containing protein [Anaerolineales bacterium]
MKKLLFLLMLLTLLASACGTSEPVTKEPLRDTSVATASPMLFPSQTPTDTVVPPTMKAIPQTIEGTLTIEVNVRSGPGTSYTSLGQLNAGEKVQIIAREGTGKWYQILYPAASGGLGWVAAQFVQIAAGTEVPLEATPTETGPSGRVVQRLNVRSGPGMTFTSLGMLEPDVVVSLTGKNSTASWFQIDYPSGPGGYGWVTAQFIQTNVSDLPVLDDYGTPIASGTTNPVSILITPTPTIGPAFADNDSAANPAIRVAFSASGTRQFTYSSQVSAPDGDPEDWVEFTPYAINGTDARLIFSLTCSGNGALTVEIWQEGSLLSGWGTLACGNLDRSITLPAGQVLEMRLAPAPGDGLRLVDYVLTVENTP